MGNRVLLKKLQFIGSDLWEFHSPPTIAAFLDLPERYFSRETLSHRVLFPKMTMGSFLGGTSAQQGHF